MADTTGDPGGDRDRRGGIDAFDGLFVRLPVAPGATEAVTDAVAAWARANGEADARDLLPIAGVNTVTLFLDRRGDGPDALVWYLDVVDAGAEPWATPADAIRRSSPLADRLAAHLDGPATVLADGVDGCRTFTHTTHPDRQAWYAESVGDTMRAPVAGDDLPLAVLWTIPEVKPGIVTRLLSGVLRTTNRLKRTDRYRERVMRRPESLALLAEERVYTETFLLDPGGDRSSLHYYLEGESVDRLYDAFADADDIEAAIAERLFRLILVDPDELLAPPPSAAGEMLVHAVASDRP